MNDAGNRIGTPHPLFLTVPTRPSDGSLTSPTLRVLYCPPNYIHLKKGGFGYIYINMKYLITESQLKIIVNEGFELEKKLIKRLLDKPTFEGICEIEFNKDDDDDTIGSILLRISQEWLIEYVTTNGGDFSDCTKKLRNNVRSLIKKHLGLEFYVGSISDC